MVLNVGIISASIVWKNRKGAQTRLQKLQKRLKQKPIYKKTLCSYPIKNLFSIFVVLCFMGGLLLFLHEYKVQIEQKYKGHFEIPQQKLKLFISPPLHDENIGINVNKIFNSLLAKKQQSVDHSQINAAILAQHQYNKVQTTVHTIVLFFLIPLICLIKQLRFEKLIIYCNISSKQSQNVSGHIDKKNFSILDGWKSYEKFQINKADQIFIEFGGDDRFTNKNTFYAIKLLMKPTKRQEQSKQYKQHKAQSSILHNKVFNQKIIIKKGSIYQTRQAVIYMSHIFRKQVNLDIKNAPIKENKQKKTKTKTT